MVNVSVRMRNGEMEIYAVGHANYGPGGSDIVCAAVSTIMQTAALGLQAIADQYPDHVSVSIDNGATVAPDKRPVSENVIRGINNGGVV